MSCWWGGGGGGDSRGMKTSNCSFQNVPSFFLPSSSLSYNCLVIPILFGDFTLRILP